MNATSSRVLLATEREECADEEEPECHGGARPTGSQSQGFIIRRVRLGQLRPVLLRDRIAEMTEDLPDFETDDLTKILIVLMRIDAKLDVLLEEGDGEEEDRS